jgi:hypothetical protein
MDEEENTFSVSEEFLDIMSKYAHKSELTMTEWVELEKELTKYNKKNLSNRHQIWNMTKEQYEKAMSGHTNC